MDVYGYVVVGEFVVGVEEVFAKMGVEDLDSPAESVDFSEVEVSINSGHQLAVEIGELLLGGKDSEIKIGIMCDHFSVSISP